MLGDCVHMVRVVNDSVYNAFHANGVATCYYRLELRVSKLASKVLTTMCVSI